MPVTNLEGKRMVVKATCRWCAREKRIVIREVDWEAWRKGELAQRAFPYLSAGDREFLISAMCEPCFDAIFAEED